MKKEAINSFIKQQGGPVEPEQSLLKTLENRPNVARFDGILLGAVGDDVILGHLGIQLRIRLDDVVSVERATVGIPNPYGKGVPSTIFVLADAEVREVRSWKASSLEAVKPFAISQPSIAGTLNLPDLHTPQEIAWMHRKGISGRPVGAAEATTTFSSNYTNTTSPKWSGTTSAPNGVTVQDDGQSDEYQNDDYSNDGSAPDDSSADVL
jgi:hypothetical protein